MNVHSIIEASLLAIVVALCWLGAIGMLRMREPTQALHYLFPPATAGIVLLAAAVYMATGAGQATGKAVLIALIILASNSVVTHATARAFRSRKLGHWEPLDGDPIEMVHEEKNL